MPSLRDGHPCAHPACSNKYRDVKEGGDYATVNDWAGKGQRFPTCPTTGYPVLNLRDKPTAWQTTDGKLSVLVGSDLYDEQIRLHQSCGHTADSAEKETRKDISFYCLSHLEGQYFPRGAGSRKNGVCEGAVIRADVDNAPPPSLPVDQSPACSTCKIHVKKHAALAFSQGMQRSRDAATIKDLQTQIEELQNLHKEAQKNFVIGDKRPRETTPSSHTSPFSPPASRHRPENEEAADSGEPLAKFLLHPFDFIA